MRINSISSVSFKRNINVIDAHTHDRDFKKSNSGADSADILKFMNKQIQSGEDTLVVTKMFPSSLNGCFCDPETGKVIADEIKANEEILKTFEGTDVKEFLAVCQPNYGSVENIEELFRKHPDKFIGLKFHPNGLKLPANNKLYKPYLEFAQTHHLPCLFHSDNAKNFTHPDEGWRVYKSRYSRPRQIYALVKKYPNVPVVMAHCGGTGYDNVDAAINTIIASAKRNKARLYVDISWVDIDEFNKTTKTREMPNLIKAIKKLKNSKAGDLTDRIMFATDAPIERYNSGDAEAIYKSYVADIHSAIKKNFGEEADSLIDKIFYKNANEVYIEKGWAKSLEAGSGAIKRSGLSKTKLGIAFLGLGAAVAAGTYFFADKIFKNKTNETKSK